MDRSTDKKGEETPSVDLDAKSLLEALTSRALRLVVADARFWGLGFAGLTGIAATFLTTATFAATTAVAAYFIVSWGIRVLWRRRSPSVCLAARRVESLFPEKRGAATAALENIGDSELAVETRKIAATILSDAGKFTDEELYGILFGVGFDESTTRRRAKRRLTLRCAATTLAGFAVATFAAVAIHDAFFPSISQESERRVAAGREEPPPLVSEPSADSPSPADDRTRSETPAASSDDSGGVSDKTVDVVAALVSDLERAANPARRLAEELDSTDAADLALAVALARELDAETATVGTRASSVLERAATVLRVEGRADDAARAFLTVRRAREFVDFLRRERETLGTSTSALDASLRGTGNAVRDVVAALRDRLAAEFRAFSILEESWRFKVDEESASELDAALRREAARLLALRAGTTPGDAPETATRDFFELINRRREALAAATARYEETRRRLSADESSEFVAFARRVAEDAGLVALCFDAGEGDATGFLEDASRRLEEAETEARLERWGRVATILGAPVGRSACTNASDQRERAEFDFLPDSSASETDALALRLTLGAIPSSGATGADVARAPEIGGAETSDEGLFSGVDAATDLEFLEREGTSEEPVAFAEGAELSRRVDAAIRKEDSFSGSVLETGARLDPQFAGGGDQGERDAAARSFSGASFNAELPPDERKRLEKAQEWSPPEEYLRRAETFRRNLQRTIREEDERRLD